jgi:hypothetical protein
MPSSSAVSEVVWLLDILPLDIVAGESEVHDLAEQLVLGTAS